MDSWPTFYPEEMTGKEIAPRNDRALNDTKTKNEWKRGFYDFFIHSSFLLLKKKLFILLSFQEINFFSPRIETGITSPLDRSHFSCFLIDCLDIWVLMT